MPRTDVNRPASAQATVQANVYEQIRDDIAARLAAGEWLPGSVIPTERALSEAYRVSHNTIRKAIEPLVAKGFLRRRQGSGTFVGRSSPQPAGVVSRRRRGLQLA